MIKVENPYPKLKTTKFGIKKLETSLYFDILNHVGMDHQCDRQIDRMVFTNSAL